MIGVLGFDGFCPSVACPLELVFHCEIILVRWHGPAAAVNSTTHPVSKNGGGGQITNAVLLPKNVNVHKSISVRRKKAGGGKKGKFARLISKSYVTLARSNT